VHLKFWFTLEDFDNSSIISLDLNIPLLYRDFDFMILKPPKRQELRL